MTGKKIKNEFIFLDHEKFRQKLQIHPDFFKQLENNSELNKIIYIKKQGRTKGEKFNLSEAFSVMNGLGQLSFAVMVAVQTTGWTPGSMELLHIEGLDIDAILAGIDKISAQETPISTDSLLGLMAWEILELLIYPCLKIAYADGEFCEDEREMIVHLLADDWGYSKQFVEKLIALTEPKLEEFNYTDFAANIKEICNIFPEINYEESRDELIGVVKKVMLADGVTHPNEQDELDVLVDKLVLDDTAPTHKFPVNAFWDYIFTDDNKDKNLKVSDILKKIPLFEHLTKRELKTIAKLVHSRQYRAGEYLFKKDEPGAAMFIIKKGTVAVVLPTPDDKEIQLATLKFGTFTGELALLDNSPRSASAKALEPTEALAFFRSELNKLLKTYPSIGSKIMKKLALIIGQRLKATNEQLYKK